MLTISYIGDHVWLITSRQTLPDLQNRQTRCRLLITLPRHLQLVDVGMEYAVDEPDTGTFVGVLIRKLDMDLPESTLKGCC